MKQGLKTALYFISSLLIPGTGQMMKKECLKGFMFLFIVLWGEVFFLIFFAFNPDYYHYWYLLSRIGVALETLRKVKQ